MSWKTKYDACRPEGRISHSHKQLLPCSLHGMKVGLLLHSTDALKMRARVLPSLLLAVVLLAAPLYLVARAPLAHRDQKSSSSLVQVDLALSLEHGSKSSKAPLVQLEFYGEALCPGLPQLSLALLSASALLCD